MNILIVYATKNGVTRECAEMLSRLLEKSHAVTLRSVKDELPSPKSFDIVILGSNVRMGAVNKSLKKYIKANLSELKKKQTAVFLCCGFSESFDDYCDIGAFRALSPTLGYHYFGGEMKPEKLHGLDKFIMKRVRNSIRTKNFENSQNDQIYLPEILPDSIVRLSDAIRELI